MKKKYEILNFNLNELNLFEYHLNKMAQNHWHLKWISNYVICYVYNEEEVHYYIDYNQFSIYQKKKEENRLEAENQISFYNDLGYKFVCSFDHYVIYKSKTPLEEIHTNEDILNELSTNVKKRSLKYNCFILLGHIFFLSSYWYFFPRETLLSFLDFTWPIFSISFFICIYFFIHAFKNKRKIELRKIKTRTLIHLYLQIIQCILLSLFIIDIDTSLPIPFILVGYYFAYNISNLLYFNSEEKKYKYVPFITNKLPYIIVCTILIFFISKDDYLDIYVPYNEYYPQNIIKTDFFIDDPIVEHYNEKESIAIHMIECRVVNYDEMESVNLFYYDDKTHLLRPFILNYYTTNSKHFFTTHIDTINGIEIRSVNEDILENDYDMSDLIFIKDYQYVRVRVSENFTKETIHQLVESINWK